MLDPAIPQERTAWLPLRLAQGRSLLARHGLRLLALELILAVAGSVPALLWLLPGVRGGRAAVIAVLLSFAATFSAALLWSASLKIVSQDLSRDPPGITVGRALLASLTGDGLRGVLRLWGWLLLLEILTLPSLLLHLDTDLWLELTRSPWITLFQGVSWYVGFATALLPMAVLFERRALRRAWALSHGRLRTAACIVALLAFGLLVDLLVDLLTDQLPGWPVGALGSAAVGIPLSVLMTVGFYVIYLDRTEETVQ